MKNKVTALIMACKAAPGCFPSRSTSKVEAAKWEVIISSRGLRVKQDSKSSSGTRIAPKGSRR